MLRGEKDTHRQYAYAMHNNIPEGPAYPIRAITDGEFRYIRNLVPDDIYIEKHVMGIQGKGDLNNPYWPTWVANSWDQPEIYRLVKRYLHRPAEELYHTAADPYEMTDLAKDPKHQETLKRLSTELDRWLTEQADPGIPEDTHEAHQAAKKGNHLYFPKP